jgi:hypothetical protein
MQVVLRLPSLQPISATDLNEAFMTTGPRESHAHSLGGDALPQASQRDADGWAPRAVDGPGDRVLVGRPHARGVDELADGMLSSGGAQS